MYVLITFSFVCFGFFPKLLTPPTLSPDKIEKLQKISKKIYDQEQLANRRVAETIKENKGIAGKFKAMQQLRIKSNPNIVNNPAQKEHEELLKEREKLHDYHAQVVNDRNNGIVRQAAEPDRPHHIHNGKKIHHEDLKKN